MTKQETMRLLLIDVRAYLRNDSMDAVYEKGRREGLLDAINEVLKPSDEPSEEQEPCVSHIAMKEYERALELIRDGAIPQGMSPALFADRVLAGPSENRGGDPA